MMKLLLKRKSVYHSDSPPKRYACMSRCSFRWMISEFTVHRKSVSPPVSSSSMGTNCSTCLSPPPGSFLPSSSLNSWLMLSQTSARTSSIWAAASGEKPTHTSTVPTPPEGGGHLKETERKHACRQSTTAAVTRVRAEITGSSRASPELRLCRANITQLKSCRWYSGSPSCSNTEPLSGNEGSAENVNTRSSAWLSDIPQTEQLPNTRHFVFFLPPKVSALKTHWPATSDKMEDVQTTWQESQEVTWVQSTAVSISASFKWFNNPPSQNGEFLIAGRAVPTTTYHESTWQLDRGPSSLQSFPLSSVQCLCIQVPWQPLWTRSLQLKVCNSLRSLKEPACFFCPRGRPADTLQQAGITVLREIHRLRGRKHTCTQKDVIRFRLLGASH